MTAGYTDVGARITVPNPFQRRLPAAGGDAMVIVPDERNRVDLWCFEPSSAAGVRLSPAELDALIQALTEARAELHQKG